VRAAWLLAEAPRPFSRAAIALVLLEDLEFGLLNLTEFPPRTQLSGWAH